MKRTILLVGGIGIILGVLLLFLTHDRQEPYDEEAVRIAACIINPDNRYYWGNIQAGIEDATRDLGINTSISLFRRFDDESQISLLEQTEYYHVDGIITIGAPHNEKIRRILRERIGQGIPVALLDTDMSEDARSFYIGTNNELAGYEAGKKLLELTDQKAAALVLVTGIDDANQSERLSGFQRAFTEAGSENIYTVFESRNDKLSVNNFLEETLRAHPEVTAIFCAEASTSNTVGLYLEDRKEYQHICVIGFDDVAPTPRLVSEGVLDGMMVQQAHAMGYRAVETLLEYIRKPDKEHQEIYTDALFVGPEDAKDYIS